MDSFQGEQMMYMGGKNKLNKKDLQIHESNRYFHAIIDMTHFSYAFIFQMKIKPIRYDISKQKNFNI